MSLNDLGCYRNYTPICLIKDKEVKTSHDLFVTLLCIDYIVCVFVCIYIF